MLLAIVIISIFALLLAAGCCKVSGECARKEEREAMKKEAQKKYDEFVRKFARDNKITIEYAEEMQMVKNYKAYLMEEYGVTENES